MVNNTPPVLYQLLIDGAVLRRVDNTSFPPDENNSDYRKYLAWVAKGNTPDPADPLPEPETPPAAILRLLLEDVSDVDETKPILDAMLVLLGG